MFELLPWHQALWQQWQQLCKSGRIPHALMLQGPEGLGKSHFANYLAQSLVCHANTDQPCGVCRSCQWVLAGNHPDVHTILPEAAGKMIKVEAIRRLNHQVSLSAASWRIFILQPAEAMNRAAANALLKTLEEPPPSSLFLLISSLPQHLPATIRSRCQILRFYPVAKVQAVQWLQTQQAHVNWDEVFAYTGTPLLAVQAQTTNALDNAKSTLIQLIELHARKANPIQVAKLWSERALLTVLGELHCICNDLIHYAIASGEGRIFFATQQKQLSQLAKQINPRELLLFMQVLNQAQNQLQHNLNATMLLEKLIMAWLKLRKHDRHKKSEAF